MKLPVSIVIATVCFSACQLAWAHEPGEASDRPTTPFPVENAVISKGDLYGKGVVTVNEIAVLGIKVAPLSEVDDRTDHVADNVATAIHQINLDLASGGSVDGFRVGKDPDKGISIFWHDLRVISLVDGDVTAAANGAGSSDSDKTLVAQYWRALLDDAVFMNLTGEKPHATAGTPAGDALLKVYGAATARAGGRAPGSEDMLQALHQSVTPDQMIMLKNSAPFTVPSGFHGTSDPVQHQNPGHFDSLKLLIPLGLLLLGGGGFLAYRMVAKGRPATGRMAAMSITLEQLDGNNAVWQSRTFELDNNQTVHFSSHFAAESVFDVGCDGFVQNCSSELIFHRNREGLGRPVAPGETVQLADDSGVPVTIRVANILQARLASAAPASRV